MRMLTSIIGLLIDIFKTFVSAPHLVSTAFDTYLLLPLQYSFLKQTIDNYYSFCFYNIYH